MAVAILAYLLRQGLKRRSNGLLTDITTYVDSGSGNLQAAIYSDNAGAPSTLLGSGTSQSVSGAGWVDSSGFSVSITSGTYYWLCFEESSATLNLALNTASSTQVDFQYPVTYGAFPSSFGTPYGSMSDSAYCIYATYTLPSSGTVYQGGSYTTSVTSPVSTGTGTQEVCTGYEIDGGSLTAGTSYTFTNVQASHTIVYEWQTQYFLTVDSAGNRATFGQTSTGSSDGGGDNGYFFATRFEATGSGILTDMTIYVTSGSGSVQTAVYSDNSGSPSTLLGSGTSQSVSGAGWVDSSGFSVSITNGAYYWLGFECSSSSLAFGISSGGASNQIAYQSVSYGLFPSSFTAFESGEIYSIYATYTASIGNPTSSGFVSQGGSYATSVTSPVSGGTGIQYICTGYEIDGGSLTAGTSYTFTNVQASHTIVYEWQTQDLLTVSGGSSTTGQGWYNSGSSATASSSWVWNTVSGESRTAITNWQLDRTNENPTRIEHGHIDNFIHHDVSSHHS